MYGIPNYKPNFHYEAESFFNEFNEALSILIGKKISRFWIMWDVNHNEWLKDGPVILEIDGDKFEFNNSGMSEFSLTINAIDLNIKLDWYGSGDEMPLIWKENGEPNLVKNLNKPITGINILLFTDVSKLLTGIEFILEKETELDTENFFSIFNGLDQNEMDKIAIQSKSNEIKRIKIN